MIYVLLCLASIHTILAAPTNVALPLHDMTQSQQPLASFGRVTDWKESGWADPRVNGGRMLDVSGRRRPELLLTTGS